ncbi:MAG: NAD-dependent epimerase/dehydratase family protein [Thermoleophilaceae bacterium]
MRVVVTGAAGFVGSHVCEGLLAAGHEVVGVDAFTRFYARERKEANVAALRTAPGFRLVEGDVLGGIPPADAAVHLAGRPGVRGGSPGLFDAANVHTTEAVMRAGIRRVVLASSSSVYAPAEGPVAERAPLAPRSDYGRSKLDAERAATRLAGELGVELVRLRYFTVYGPRQRPDMAFSRFVDAALSGIPAPLLGDGRQVRDFTYVGDAAAATLLALERGRPGAAYNVSGGRPVALSDALAVIAREAGGAPPLQRRPRDPREHRSTAADLTLARAELGYAPGTPLEEGIARQVAHLAAASARTTLRA